MTSIGAETYFAAGKPAPLRLTRRGRVVLGALLVAPVAAGLVFFSVANSANAGSEPVRASFETVTVGSGESLWTIAERVAPSQDPRDVIAEFERLNGLDDAAVFAGQSLAVPQQYAD